MGARGGNQTHPPKKCSGRSGGRSLAPYIYHIELVVAVVLLLGQESSKNPLLTRRSLVSLGQDLVDS